MITIKTTRNKFFTEYLKWLDPVIPLSKGERDILAAMLTLHYGHKMDYFFQKKLKKLFVRN